VRPAASPGNLETALLVAKLIARTFAAGRRKLTLSEHWNIGVVDAPIEDFLNPDKRPAIRWRQEDPARYYADPFGIETADGLDVLAEEYVHGEGIGRIVALRGVDSPHPAPPARAFATAGHASYPQLIEEGGRIYCVPETSEAREIALYQAQDFPDAWTRLGPIVADFPGVDPTVFQHDGRWWLLCTSQDGIRHVKNSTSTLYAWHAPSLHGPWSAHQGNPLKTDVRSTRAAGVPFVHDGRLFRPTQDCSETYGGAVTITEVAVLTPNDFFERPVARVVPYDSRYPDGLHTLTVAGVRTLIDGKRMRPRSHWQPWRSRRKHVSHRPYDRSQEM
jgi:hypothetical protein